MNTSNKRPFSDVSSSSSPDSPPPKVHCPDTVDLPFTEEEHAEQDRRVLAELKEFDQLSDRHKAAFLPHLLCIILDQFCIQYGRLLNPIYAIPSSSAEIIEENQLSELLKDAWSRKKFAGI